MKHKAVSTLKLSHPVSLVQAMLTFKDITWSKCRLARWNPVLFFFNFFVHWEVISPKSQTKFAIALQIWTMPAQNCSVHKAPRSARNPSVLVAQTHTYNHHKTAVNNTVSFHPGKPAQTKASRRQQSNSKSTANHIRSLIMHFGSHPHSDCQRSKHMALILCFLLFAKPNPILSLSFYLSSSKVLASCSKTHTKRLVHFSASLKQVLFKYIFFYSLPLFCQHYNIIHVIIIGRTLPRHSMKGRGAW